MCPFSHQSGIEVTSDPTVPSWCTGFASPCHFPPGVSGSLCACFSFLGWMGAPRTGATSALSSSCLASGQTQRAQDVRLSSVTAPPVPSVRRAHCLLVNECVTSSLLKPSIDSDNPSINSSSSPFSFPVSPTLRHSHDSNQSLALRGCPR